MPTHAPGGSAAELSGRHRDPMADLRRRALARLAERVDPARNRHKPLSLVRQEAKRVLEQFLDAEAALLPRAEKEAMAEELLATAPGMGPLEELFRDEAVREILVLNPGQVIARKNESWLPANARFQAAAHLRAFVARAAELGEPVAGPSPAGGLHVKLPNGFRLLAVVPPDVLEVPPMVLLARGGPAAAPANPPSGVGLAAPTPVGPRSGVNLLADTPRSSASLLADGPMSGKYPAGPGSRTNLTGVPPTPPSPVTPAAPDPSARLRQKVTERIIGHLASAGVYDLNLIALPELRKLVLAHVADVSATDRLGLDANAQERLALEILAAMNR